MFESFVNQVLRSCDNLVTNGLMPEEWKNIQYEIRDEIRTVIKQEKGKYQSIFRIMHESKYKIECLIAFIILEKQKFFDSISGNEIKRTVSVFKLKKHENQRKIGEILIELDLLTEESLNHALLVQKNEVCEKIHEEFIDVEQIKERNEADVRIVTNGRSLFWITVLTFISIALLSPWAIDSLNLDFNLTSRIFNCFQSQLLLLIAIFSLVISAAEKNSPSLIKVNYPSYWRTLALTSYALSAVQTSVPVDILLSLDDLNPYIAIFWLLLPIFFVTIFFQSILEVFEAIFVSKIRGRHQFTGGIFLSAIFYFIGSLLLYSEYLIFGQAFETIGLAMISCSLIAYIKKRIEQVNLSIAYTRD